MIKLNQMTAIVGDKEIFYSSLFKALLTERNLKP